MVEQFGLAMTLSFFVNISAFTSGTINGLVGSIRHPDELSITVVPAAANFGAHSSDTDPPAEKRARAGFWEIASAGLFTKNVLPLNSISLPTERSDATGISSVTGNLRSANTWIILVPTRPVTPTTATFIFIFFPENPIKNPPLRKAAG